jgi:hypothetical protein
MLTEELHERVNKLSHVKRQLLNQQLRRNGTARPVPHPVGFDRAAFASPVLSYTQESVLRTQLAYPGATFYNRPQVQQIDGPLNVSALQQALRYLWARHDVLRTTFETVGSRVQPVVRDPRSTTPPALELDYRDLVPLTSTVMLEALLEQHKSKPIDLTCDPPLSALLLRVAPGRHILSLVHHFIAFDSWSLGIFNRDLSVAYAAFAAESVPQLAAPPLRFADYAAWQHAPENEEHLAELSHFWRWQLAKAAGAGACPRPGSTAPDFSTASFEFCVPAGTLRRLELLAQRENATLFMLLLASLQVLLSRCTQRTELAVGTLVANRQLWETEEVVGNFTNRLLLWGNLSGNPTFRQLLRRTRGTTLNAYARQDVPLDRVAAALYGGHPAPGDLCPVMLDYINEPLLAPSLHGLAVTQLLAHSAQSEYPLHVTVQRTHGHLRVRLQMWPDFGLRTTVPHMAYHWNTLLGALAENPEQQIGSLPLVKPAPKSMLGAWLGPANSLSNSPAVQL